MKIALAAATAALLTACSTVSYRPVQETSFDRLAREGCVRAGDRFSVTAQVNSAYRETIVLWDGVDGSRTVAVSLPEQGLRSKLGGIVGKSRYELGFERLQELRARGTPVTVTMRCEAARLAPAADRFSYFEQGRRVEFEF